MLSWQSAHLPYITGEVADSFMVCLHLSPKYKPYSHPPPNKYGSLIGEPMLLHLRNLYGSLAYKKVPKVFYHIMFNTLSLSK